jgi:nucleoredoxin
MSGLVDLLGDKLLSGSGEIATSDALAGKGAVALYFSAHWCPPCRGFTPQFAGWYKENLKERGLEVVFVSSDRDENAFKEYFAEMPWLALPYSSRELKAKLSQKFKVQGIPSVVILDGNGAVITKDGRAALSSDPTGEEFPWKPKSLKEILSGAKLIGKDGPVESGTLDGKVFGLYFSAHWCPPCRGFTPQLAEWYSKSLKNKGLEIVFVSSDRDEASFNDYFKEQPWLALDYSNRKEKEQLSNLFGVRGIPSFVIVDTDGSAITKEGRAAVSSDPEGAEFPWYPKPVQNLKAGPGSLNDAAVVIAFCETADAAAQKAVEEAMSPLAKKYIDAAKADGEDDPKVCFMIATEAGGISGQLRKMMSMTTDQAPSKLMLVNIDDDGAFYDGPAGEITPEAVEQFVTAFEAGSLERKQLQK